MYYLPMGGYLRAVKIVFGIIIALSVLAAFSSLLEVLLLNKMVAGEAVTDQQVNFNDARQGVVGMLQFLALIAGAITFILWLYRAYQNSDAVAPGERRYGKGWAIGGWFVPIMNLFRPKQVVNDIWRAGGHPAEPSALLASWWAFWLLSNFVSNGVGRMLARSEEAQEIRNASIAYTISSVLDVVAAVLAVMVAVKLTQRLDERAKLGPPQPRFERESDGVFPQRGEVMVPPKFGSGQPYEVR